MFAEIIFDNMQSADQFFNLAWITPSPFCQYEEVIRVYEVAWILLTHAYEVFAGYRIDKLLVFLPANIRVDVEDRVAGLVLVDAVEALKQTTHVNNSTCQSQPTERVAHYVSLMVSNRSHLSGETESYGGQHQQLR